MKKYESIAVGVPKILFPKKGTEFDKWAVIACDQFTSEPDYWKKVKEFVGDAPSTMNLIYPEVYLGEKDPDSRIANIREHMNLYLDQNLFDEWEGFIYVERQTDQGIRKGLMVCLDLECYDFHKGAESLIRATEGTILERIPPRVNIREGASLEVPHVMVLIDDPDNSVIGPLTADKKELGKLYDFELMLGSGHLSGYKIDHVRMEKNVAESLQALSDPEKFATKYGLNSDSPAILYAMGDGNHSLATAKTIWEKVKNSAENISDVMNSALRYSLVELVNLHDEALNFEPIHRVLFDLDSSQELVNKMTEYYPGRLSHENCRTAEEMTSSVDTQQGSPHKIGAITTSGFSILEVSDPESNLPAGTLQNFLDSYMKISGMKNIDYVHGTESVIQIGRQSGCMGFYLPAMDKHELFKTVILDGALPRKTFSLGEAWEKRFYMEVRKLSE
jgi:hypothetical protein